VEAFAQQDSSLISVFAASNALIGLPANAAARSAGTLVDILPLDLP
jgi:molybdopterin biosynthesis enzyme